MRLAVGQDSASLSMTSSNSRVKAHGDVAHEMLEGMKVFA